MGDVQGHLDGKDRVLSEAKGIARRGLRRGPIHIVKRNKPAAVVLSEDDYSHLAGAAGARRGAKSSAGALDWLLNHKSPVARSRADIDAVLNAERAAWGARR